jgi:tetratricopeptide (TPR) repeat protein
MTTRGRGTIRGCVCALLAGLSALAPGAEPPGGDEGKALFVAKTRADLLALEPVVAEARKQLEAARGGPAELERTLELVGQLRQRSRLSYYLEVEADYEQALRSPSVTAPLEEAIGLCAAWLAAHPNQVQGDQVLLVQGTMLRELGKYPEMSDAFARLAERFPRSPLAVEALVTLGDYYFDRSDLQRAGELYRDALSRPETCTSDFARYKLGWVHINQSAWAEAVKLLERVATGQAARAGLGCQPPEYGPPDLRMEAAVDLVFCYPELFPPAEVRQRISRLSLNREELVRVLARLARRYVVRQQIGAARGLYRELLALDPDPEGQEEYHQALESLK